MSHNLTNGDSKRERLILGMFILVSVALVVAAMSFMHWVSPGKGSEGKEVGARTNVQIESLEDLNGLDQETIASLQEEAQVAAADAVGLPPITGTVTERPDYVSPVEWQVLKAVAAQSDDSDESLTRLVYKLRFSKQWEIWQSAEAGAQRDALARQLLSDIPEQVASNDLARGDAQHLQGEILSQLYPDPQQRRQRMAEEAERISVRFEIY